MCFIPKFQKYLRGERGKSRFEKVSKTLNQMKMSKTVNAVCLPLSCGLFRRLNLSVSELLNPHTSSHHNIVFKTIWYKSYKVFFLCVKMYKGHVDLNYTVLHTTPPEWKFRWVSNVHALMTGRQNVTSYEIMNQTIVCVQETFPALQNVVACLSPRR